MFPETSILILSHVPVDIDDLFKTVVTCGAYLYVVASDENVDAMILAASRLTGRQRILQS